MTGTHISDTINYHVVCILNHKEIQDSVRNKASFSLSTLSGSPFHDVGGYSYRLPPRRSMKSPPHSSELDVERTIMVGRRDTRV